MTPRSRAALLAVSIIGGVVALPACFSGNDGGAAGAAGNKGSVRDCAPGTRCVADGDAGADAGGGGNGDGLLGHAGSHAGADAGGAGGVGGVGAGADGSTSIDVGTVDNSTWSDDGWNDRTPELLPIAWPEPRMGHALAYDDARKQIVMYGGGSASDRFDDVWERDADGVWSKPGPGAGRVPVPRYFHAMAYDAARSRTVLFGGDGIVARIGDIWDYDGASATWTDRQVAQSAAWPLPHDGHTLIFEPVIDRSVEFGGCCAGTGGLSNEVWEWNGAGGSWSNATPSALPAAWPSGRRYHAMAHDTERGVLYLFGGAELHPSNDNVAIDDLWEYDPMARKWTDRTPEPRPTAWPSARFMHAMAYDAARGKVVLFGGTAGAAPGEPWSGLGDLWEYDATSGTWTEIEPTDPDAWPTKRWAHAMAYDQTREAVVMFGGLTDGPFGQEHLRDTWEYRP